MARSKKTSAAPKVVSDGRFPTLDLLRGGAVLWMTVFHFAFDLNHFGYIQQDFYRAPLWTVQRTCILSLFLFCAGFGQAMAVQAGQNWGRFWRRWLQIAGCAVAVSVGSALMFPNSWIYFGVLHGMAVMLILCRLTATKSRVGWLVCRSGYRLGLRPCSTALFFCLGHQRAELDGLATNPSPKTMSWLCHVVGHGAWKYGTVRWGWSGSCSLIPGYHVIVGIGCWSLSWYRFPACAHRALTVLRERRSEPLFECGL
jgi:hypothetical protein